MSHSNNKTTTTFAEINQTMEQKKHRNIIAGFWRRTFAFSIDTSLLAIVSATLVFTFYSHTLSQMPPVTTQSIAFLVTLFYFGWFDSKFGGQTPGKRLLKIAVVQKNASFLPLSKSFARTFLLSAPLSLSHLVNPFNAPLFLNITLNLALLATIYLYLFNRKTRQALHDLITNSYVINKNYIGKEELPVIWKGHFAICGALLVLFSATNHYYLSPTTHKWSKNNEIRTIYNELIKQDGITAVALSSIQGLTNKEKTFRIDLKKNTALNKQSHSSIAIESVLSNYKNIYQYDYIVVNETYGFNFLFLRSEHSKYFRKAIK